MASLRPGSRGLRYDALHCVGGVSIDGDTVLGTDESSLVTVNATLLIRKVDDSGIVATPGIRGELSSTRMIARSTCARMAIQSRLPGQCGHLRRPATIGGDLVCGSTLTVTSATVLRSSCQRRGRYRGRSDDPWRCGPGDVRIECCRVRWCVLATSSRWTRHGTHRARSEIVYNLADGVAYVCTATDPVAASRR